ncbi:MAG: flavin reductase family protein [Chloroflexota bacterium]
MAKRRLRPSTALQPVPAVLVTCVDNEGRANIITLAWVGVVCSVPPMVSIAVRPERFSHRLIDETKEFVVNVPSVDLVWAVDYCGTRSGKNEDKFAGTGLTPLPASQVKAPIIAECPIGMECVVRQKLSLGSHDLFLGEVVAVQADESVLDESGAIAVGKVNPIAYAPIEYWGLGSKLSVHGYSRKVGRTGV